MSIYASAGARVFIGSGVAQKLADWVEADFTSQSWTEIGWVENVGSFGDSSQEVTHTSMGVNRDFKLKGSKNAGNLQLVCANDPQDAGQVALLAAQQNPNDFAFKIVFNDAPATGASPKPSERKFVGKVMTAQEQLDGANNVMKLNTTIGINSNIVRKNASAT